MTGPRLRRLEDLLGFRIHASDGDIGRVHDLYFDDLSWTVRYLVIDVRHWLPGRRVLLSPASVRELAWGDRQIVVALSRAQIRHSPGVDTDKPVGRQNMVLFRESYSLPYYWAMGGYLWGPARAPDGSPGYRGDPHLRSTRLLRGYGVRAVDGDVGHIEGFLMDDASWALRYVVTRTGHWGRVKRVLIPSDRIAWVSWIELTAHVELPRHTIVDAPSFDPAHAVTGEDEARLSALYGRSPHPRARTT